MNPRHLGRLLRTVRHLRARQVGAQLRHRLRGGVRPVAPRDPPPRLAGRAAVAFLPAPSHARFDGVRRFRLLNREVGFGEAVDWDHAAEGPLFAYHLHQFDYLRRPSVPPAARRRLVLDWIERHPGGIGWEPHPLGQRCLTWTKLLLRPGDLPLDAGSDARVRTSLAAQVETLDRHLEVHLLANHYLSNLLAVVFAGIVFEGGRAEAWLARERELRAELREQVLDDGAHTERSPMYHALLLENVLDLVNVASATPGRAPAVLLAALADAAARMQAALRVLTRPDGEIALFGDSALGIAQSPASLAAYARALAVPAFDLPRPGVLHAAGYVRLAAGPFDLIASVAGHPSYQPGHAHCDALAFELSVSGERVVTDTGVAEYIPGALRDLSRATRSHATLEVGGQDQAEVWAAHRVGGRPRVTLVSVEPGRRAEATCAGWATRGTVHRRVFRVDADALEIVDALEGQPREVRLTLPLAPALEPRLDGTTARLALDRGGELEIELPAGARWRVERLPYFPEFGRVVHRAALVGTAGELARGEWRFAVSPRGAFRDRPRRSP